MQGQVRRKHPKGSVCMPSIPCILGRTSLSGCDTLEICCHSLVVSMATGVGITFFPPSVLVSSMEALVLAKWQQEMGTPQETQATGPIKHCSHEREKKMWYDEGKKLRYFVLERATRKMDVTIRGLTLANHIVS